MLEKLDLTIQPDTIVHNWTSDKGYLGDNFTVVDVSNTTVDVQSPNANNLQSIPKKDFVIVFNMWHEYLSGSVHRQQVRDKTRYSKYIISILHQLRV
jgi:hypothetical protein